MARGKSTASPICKLVVRLRDNEFWTFEQIGEHIKMTRRSVQRVYKLEKNPIVKKPAVRKRITNIRLSRLSKFVFRKI